MSDLVEFLRARIADDLVEAEKQNDEQSWVIEPWQIRRDEYEGNYTYREYLQIAKARVLREVEAKRRVLARHVLAEQADGDGFVTLRCMVCAPEGSEPFYPCPTVRLLAAVYADHPDYRPEWAPTT